MTPLFYLLLGAALLGYISLSCATGRNPMNILIPYWTRSYELYAQPHAIWLDAYDRPGANLPKLKKVLDKAKTTRRIPEIVIYAIPLRDLGQASEGGFATMQAYWADSQLNAKEIKDFSRQTGIRPRIFLEPDGLPLAVQYRRDHHNDPESSRIYKERIAIINRLIGLYQEAGAAVYLDAGHSGWFDYGLADVQRIASALSEAGIARANGVASNISNRQPVTGGPEDRNEWHYMGRLLPLLPNKSLDVVVDTSRNGGVTNGRIYYLAPDGGLIDNEIPTGRLVGGWTQETDRDGNPLIRLKPFHGKAKTLTRLIGKEKYTYDAGKRLLKAPAWLDAVGDVKLGPSPTDTPPSSVANRIQRYRYIKPPDDCDGVLHCPPGHSKHDINQDLARRQPRDPLVRADIWH